jgi:hypothetical protein
MVFIEVKLIVSLLISLRKAIFRFLNVSYPRLLTPTVRAIYIRSDVCFIRCQHINFGSSEYAVSQLDFGCVQCQCLIFLGTISLCLARILKFEYFLLLLKGMKLSMLSNSV